MSTQDFLDALRRHWRIPVVVVMVAGLAVITVVATRPSPKVEYVSTARVGLADPTTDEELPLEFRGPLLPQERFATSAAVTAKAVDQLKVPTSIRPSISVYANSSDDPRQMDIKVSASEPRVAQQIAQAQAEGFTELRKSRQVNELTANEIQILGQINTSVNRLNQLNAKTTPNPNPAQQTLEDAERLTLPGTIQSLREQYARLVIKASQADGNAFLAFVTPGFKQTVGAKSYTGPLTLLMGLAVAIGIGGALLADRLDAAVHRPEEASDIFRAPVLAVVPPRPRRRGERGVAVLQRRTGPRGEAFHGLAGTLEAMGQSPRRLYVTSPVDSPEVPVVGTNLAVSLAQLGRRVVLIGTAPQHEKALQALGVECGPGFSELVDRAARHELNGSVNGSFISVASVENLWVLAPGVPNGRPRLQAVDRVLAATESAFKSLDICIILGRPVLDDPGSSVVASEIGSVLWVVQLGATPRAAARVASERLDLAGVTPVGVAVVASA